MKSFLNSKINNIATPVFFLLVVILTIAFLWGECQYFNFSQTINDQKIANFFTSFLGILGIVSLVVLLAQHKDQKRLNSAEIIPMACTLKLNDSLGKWYDENGNQFRSVEVEDSFLGIKLTNVSQGMAKHINAVWEFDRDLARKKVPFRYIPLFIKKEVDFEASYLLPQDFTYIRIPKLYLALYHYNAFAWGFRLNAIREEVYLKSEIQLNLKVTYTNIYGGPQSSVFETIIETEHPMRVQKEIEELNDLEEILIRVRFQIKPESNPHSTSA